MEHTYQRPLQLPAGYSVLSAEEMTYTEGGAFSINITPQQVMAFGINVTVNLLGMMGRYAFQGAVSGMQNALNDGLSVGDAIGHYWGKLNTWSKVATIGMAGLGGYYAYCQARSIYLSIKNLVDAFKNTYNEIQAKKKAEQEAAEQQNCLPTLVALCCSFIDPERSVLIYEKASAALFLRSPLPRVAACCRRWQRIRRCCRQLF